METLTNTAIGFAVALVSNLAILPLFGFDATLGDAAGIGVAFTVVSLARQYTLRRLFNGRSVWASIKARFRP